MALNKTAVLIQNPVLIFQAFIKENGEPKMMSGKQEKYESIFNCYI